MRCECPSVRHIPEVLALPWSITSFVDRFKHDCQCCIVKPTNKLRNHAQGDGGAPKIPASDLLLHDAKSMKDVQHYHFTKVKLTSVFSNVARNELEVGFCHMVWILSVVPAIVKCESEILSNLSILRRGIGNEAELRFAK